MNYKLLSLSLFFTISGNQTIRSMESDETEQCAKHIETEDKKQDLFHQLSITRYLQDVQE